MNEQYTCIKSFTEVKRLGNGAFSSVFEAISKETNAVFAIKKIPFKKEYRDTTLNEIKILQKLNSDYVVRYINHWIEDNYYLGEVNDYSNPLYKPENTLLLHIQMELCSVTLNDVIKSFIKTTKKSMSLQQYSVCCKILIQLLDGVNYLHCLKPAVIHRDLKPENIMIVNDSNDHCVKIVDFGLSTYHTYIDQSHTKYIGTRLYRAPEINDSIYTTKSDIYSLGIIIEQMFNMDLQKEASFTKCDKKIESYYKKIFDIATYCMFHRGDKRPTCAEMLSQQSLWAYFIEGHNLYNDILDLKYFEGPNSFDENYCEKAESDEKEEDMSKPIQILKQKSNGFAIDTKEVFRVLDRVANKNIAVISISGNKRTGKSFLLNYFLRYLRSGGDSENGNWAHSECNQFGFEWRGGPERHTVGIWMWSEPFIIQTSDGSEVALLLLDTQGNFDEKTTFQECVIIFSLSALLSSTLILNMKNDLSEDKLQFVEFFACFAEAFNGEPNSSEKMFQQLMFLIRDWQYKHDYAYGCHDNDGPKTKNFKKDFIEPHDGQCNEAQHTRAQILSYFNNVSSFLMPFQGKDVMERDFTGQSDLIEEEFLDYVKIIVPLILSSSRIVAKKIGGQKVTGSSLKEYLLKWAEIIETHKFPEAKTLASAVADVNYMLAFKHAMTVYETKIKTNFELHQTDVELYNSHKIAKEECLQYFLTEPKGRINEQTMNNMIEELRVRINQIYEIFRSNNCSRIDREKSEKNLNKALEEQRLQQNILNEQREETERKVGLLLEEISKEKEAIHLKQMQQQMEFMRENARLSAEMMQQKLEHMREIAEMNEKSLEDRLEAERKNSEKMAELLAESRRPLPPKDYSCTIL